MKYIIPLNITNYDEFFSSINIPSYVEFKDSESFEEETEFAVPEDNLDEVKLFLRDKGVRFMVEPTYRVFENGYTMNICDYESNDLEEVKAWLSDSDEEKEYVVFKNRVQFFI